MDTTTPPLAAEELMLVDKPAGISSFGVVARVRHQLSDQAGIISIKGKDSRPLRHRPTYSSRRQGNEARWQLPQA